MKTVKLVQILLAMIVVFSVLTPLADAQIPTVYALLAIADADPSIGRAVVIDQKRVEDMLVQLQTICPVEKRVLLSSNGELKSNLLLQWLQEIQPESNDTLFIYYSGHGGMDRNQRTFLYLQDGVFMRSKLVDAVKGAKDSRLQLIITDCCSNGPEPPKEVVTPRPVPSKKALMNLFLEHEGLLHITAASEKEYSWCSPRQGGWFTRALIDAFDDSSDTNGDGFVSWEEVFSIARADTQKRFEQVQPYFSDQQKRDMRNRGITGQNPKAYSLPQRVGAFRSLWEARNPDSAFSISTKVDKPEYSIGDFITLRVQATADCYITLLNWNTKDELVQLFPNRYDSSDFIKAGEEYSFPSLESGFDFTVFGPRGEERFKIIATRDRADSEKIRKLIPADDGGSMFARIAIIPRKASSGKTTEAKVLEALSNMERRNWAETNCTIKVR